MAVPSLAQTSIEVAIQARDVVGLVSWSVLIHVPSGELHYKSGSVVPAGAGADAEASADGGLLSVSGTLASPADVLDDSLAVLSLSAVTLPEHLSVSASIDLLGGGTIDLGEAEVVVSRAILPGDLDENGVVDFSDFFLLADFFGSGTLTALSSRHGDISGDGRVDFNDFFFLADNFGRDGAFQAQIVLDGGTASAGVVVVGSIDVTGVGSVEISGAVATDDTVGVEVYGTIEE